jgi:hypothetical protein
MMNTRDNWKVVSTILSEAPYKTFPSCVNGYESMEHVHIVEHGLEHVYDDDVLCAQYHLARTLLGII